jgi:hypothetical protein
MFLCTVSWSVGQSVSLSGTNLDPLPDSYYCQTVSGLLLWGTLFEKRTGLQFTIADGTRQRSHSWARVPRESRPYFSVSDLKFLKPIGPGSPIYIFPEQGGLFIPPTGFSLTLAHAMLLRVSKIFLF